MINKKSLWFVTLFSLILVLSVYYITMPSELLIGSNDVVFHQNEEEEEPKPTVQTEESDFLTALRVESENQVLEEVEELQSVLAKSDASSEEKNNAYEKIKDINLKRGEEGNLEKQIQDSYGLKSFVKIEGDQIRVVVQSEKHDVKLANDIMRTVQSKYDKKMYISVKFQKD